MNKLEQYLDQVCRGVGGPRAMRQHIRQELREHLLDAATEHRSAGLSEEQAIDRAIEDFGGPEQVRSELEATHGHRMMAVVIDKALQWKEHTMKAKWLWSTWAHAALLLTIAAEVALLWAMMIFIMPRFQQMRHEGWIASSSQDAEAVIVWGFSFLGGLLTAFRNHLWIWIPLLVLAVLFEWRVRSENKTSIRLTALGTIAFGMMIVVGLTAAAVVLPLMVGTSDMYMRPPETAVRARVAGIDSAIASLKKAAPAQDWLAMADQARDASKLLGELSQMGAAAPTLLAADDQPSIDALRVQLRSARESLHEAQHATRDQNMTRFDAAMAKFEISYAALRQPATMPSR